MTKGDQPKQSVLNRRGPVWTVLGVLLVLGIIAATGYRTIYAPASNGNSETTPDSEKAPRHLIVISIDTLRADHLGCYGHANAQTPAIDKLAGEGALFEKHYTCYPLTLPSHLTQLTGVSTLGHRVRDNLYHRLPEQFATLPEELSKQGFTTGAFVSAFTMRSGSGIERGFSIYDDEGIREAQQGKLTIPERKAEVTLSRAAEWLKKNKDAQRVFCFVHLFDPHTPYSPPADLAAKFAGKPNAGYEAEIAYTDRELGRFFEQLRALNMFDNAVIAITADHGEGLGEHDELSHGYFCYDATTHVPLIIRAPGLKACRPVAITRNYDLAPTLLDLLAIRSESIARQTHGRSLKAALDKPGEDLGLIAYIESHYAYLNANWAKIRALRTASSLTVFSGDLVEHYVEPRQLQSQHDTHPGDVQRARAEIERLLGSLMPPRRGKGTPGQGGGMGTPYPGEAATEQDFEPETINDTRELPAPASKAKLLLRYQEAELAYDEQLYQGCAEKLRKLIADEPKFLMAHKLLAGVNQLLVETEWKSLGIERARELALEAARSLAAGADLSEAARNFENARRMKRNAALLCLWLNEGALMKRLQAGGEADAALAWLDWLLRYRTAKSEGREIVAKEAEQWLAQAKLEEPIKQQALLDLKRMQSGEELKLAPWE
ncbi:Ulvan-active sulfatase [Planctomycetaceae bacterium]|nr:Ulvan-active sulfatase [Planctomycetaceae bacterium]